MLKRKYYHYERKKTNKVHGQESERRVCHALRKKDYQDSQPATAGHQPFYIVENIIKCGQHKRRAGGVRRRTMGDSAK
jgi:hypothetical protein